MIGSVFLGLIGKGSQKQQSDFFGRWKLAFVMKRAGIVYFD
jgi:hypothetical protein